MADPIAEVYNPKTNVWADIVIDGAKPSACFGYTPLSSMGDKIVIVGGSDGGILLDTTVVVDFDKKTAITIDSDFSSLIAMSKVVFHKSSSTLYSFMGMGSEGQVFKAKLAIN